MFVAPTDFVLNGKGHGEVGEALADVRYDPGLMRPYFDEKKRNCVLVNTGRTQYRKVNGQIVTNKRTGEPIREPIYEKRLVADLVMNHGVTKLVHNATVLSKEQWVTLSSVVRTAYRKRLRAWSDLMATSSYGGFDGMSTMMLEYQTMSDPGEAVVDFDAMTEGRNDQPLFKLEGLPLPITHCDFWFPERLLAISRRQGTPLNVRMAEAAGRRCAEMVEQTLIGTITGPTLGSSAAGSAGIPYGRTPSVYGLLNHPDRIIKNDMTAPTTVGWKPETTVHEILEALELLRDNNFYGDYMVYTSRDWDTYLDGDYYALATSGMTAPSQTLRQRIRQIDEVRDIRRLDFLSNTFTMIIVQMTPDVIQAVNGMDITTLQWPSMGGMRVNFKVMTIQVPLITPDYDGNTGIAVLTTA